MAKVEPSWTARVDPVVIIRKVSMQASPIMEDVGDGVKTCSVAVLQLTDGRGGLPETNPPNS